MKSILLRADWLLRSRPNGAPPGETGATLFELTGVLLVCGLFYGGVMGSFGGVSGERFWQATYSAAKVPLLLLATFCLSLPSFFVLNTLLGVRSDFAKIFGALIASQAGLTVILASLAPYTALWYCSFASYSGAILFNAGMFAVASISGQILLWRTYQPLIARNRIHRWLLPLWLLLYAFVGIQMAWVLRPFIGDPTLPVRFFREDRWGNAYVVVLRLIWEALKG